MVLPGQNDQIPVVSLKKSLPCLGLVIELRKRVTLELPLIQSGRRLTAGIGHNVEAASKTFSDNAYSAIESSLNLTV